MTLRSFLPPAALAGILILPLGVSFALAQKLVYVPMGDLDEILIIDTATDAIIGKISDVPTVHGLAETPDGKYIVAGSFETREVGSTPPPKPTAVSKKEHVVHHAGAPADAAGDTNEVSTITILSTEDNSVVRRIDVPGGVHHVTIGPKGRFAVVTLPQKGAISAIDLTTFEVVATIATGPVPNYAVFSPDGAQVYVSNAGNNTVTQVDTSDWSIQWSVKVGGKPEHVVLSGDGATLYVNNIEDGTVSVVSPKDRRVVETITIGDRLHGIDLSDDGKTLFVAAREQNRLVSIDLATGATSASTLAPAPYHLAAIKGTGKLYISSADEPTMWVVDQKTSAVLKEIPIGGRGHQLAQGAGG